MYTFTVVFFCVESNSRAEILNNIVYLYGAVYNSWWINEPPEVATIRSLVHRT